MSAELVDLTSDIVGVEVEVKFDSNGNPDKASTASWKGLMDLMQKNQVLQAKNGNKISGGAGRGLKRTAGRSSSWNTGNGTENENSPSPSPSVVKRAKLQDLELRGGDGFEVNNKYNSGSTTLTTRATSNFDIKLKNDKTLEVFGAQMVLPKFDEGKDCWSQEKIEITLNISGSRQEQASSVNGNGRKKQCPFYKIIPDTGFSVDAFSYGDIPGVEVYFLSHFHSDHYVGLTKKFSKTLLCSPATGNLVKMKLGVSDNCIRKLDLHTVYTVQGTQVVLMEANHCPGSVMFIFRLRNGKIIFHTGDFRFTPDMLTNPFVSGLPRVDSLYLDTTYCDPKFDFPSQIDAIAQVLESVERHIECRPKTLIVCGAYCIGKERVFFTLAKALNLQVFCEPDKRRVIKALEIPEYLPLMGDREELCQIHVLPMMKLNPTFLSEYLTARISKYNNILAVKPTGWEFSRTGKGLAKRSFLSDTVTIIGVPYSEHSSFSELKDIVKTLKPIKIQPTVNVGSEPKRAAMNGYFNEWLRKF